jgi:ABC-type polysaccharide/polyol phosphate transport system ATPase subunit
MVTRLGFSTIIHTPADILVLDEVLAVGDVEFSAKCRQFLARFTAGGGTLIVASHDHATLEATCESGVCLDRGRVIASGAIGDVISAYHQLMHVSPTRGTVVA